MPKSNLNAATLFNWEEHLFNQYNIPTANSAMAHKNFLESWNDATRYFLKEKKYAPALNRYHQALNAVLIINDAEKASEDHYLAYCCEINIAECLFASHDYATAIDHLNAALKVIESGIDEKQTSNYINFKKPFIHQEAYSEIFSKMAACFYQVGKFNDAKFNYQMAVINAEKLLELNDFDKNQAHHAESATYFDFGNNDLVLHDYVSAANHFQKSADALLALPQNKIDVSGQDSIAKAMHHAGRAHLMNHNFQEAKSCYEKAYSYYQPLIKKTGNKVYLDVVVEILENMAYANIKLGNLDEAKKNYKQAEECIDTCKSVIAGKRYRFNDRSRLEQSIDALKQMTVAHPEQAQVLSTVSQPTKPAKGFAYHFMRFFTKKADAKTVVAPQEGVAQHKTRSLFG